ncbi:unnamed protein product [Mytilus edulis]|uniref:Uncharacterized protein n=1 Tax=Mytilus edulis TaxID=6550 RepID=A0A8S3R8G3_MYTED|nr:unnamed protein product [Mytilus edulis]
MDFVRNLQDSETSNDVKRKKNMSKLTKEKRQRNRERKNRDETVNKRQQLDYQNVSLDVKGENSDISNDINETESDKNVYKTISKPEFVTSKNILPQFDDQNLGISAEIEGPLTDVRKVRKKDLEEIKPTMENILRAEIESDDSQAGCVEFENSPDKTLYKENEDSANYSRSKHKRRRRRKHKKHYNLSVENDDKNLVSASEIDEVIRYEDKKLQDANGFGNINDKLFSMPLLSTMAEDSAADHTSDVSSEDEQINVFKLPVVHLKNDGKSTEEVQDEQPQVKTFHKQKKQHRKISNKATASVVENDDQGKNNYAISPDKFIKDEIEDDDEDLLVKGRFRDRKKRRMKKESIPIESADERANDIFTLTDDFVVMASDSDLNEMIDSEKDLDHVISLPPIKTMDFVRNLQDSETGMM